MKEDQEENENTAVLVDDTKTFRVKLRGVTDLLMNSYTVETLKRERGAKQKKTAEENAEEWRDHLYYDEKTKQLYIFPQALEKCLVIASGPIRQGKTFFKNLFESGVFVEQDVIPIDGLKGDIDDLVKNKKCYVREDVVRIPPKTGARVLKHRLAIPVNWTATFTLTVAHPEITKDVLELVLRRGGKYTGLCDWRPRFGRFEIVDLKEII